MGVWVAFLKFMVKSKALLHFPTEMIAMRSLIDAALTASYLSFKREQLGSQTWWELFKEPWLVYLLPSRVRV